jgi:methyl-accepting chemotaxis protein
MNTKQEHKRRKIAHFFIKPGLQVKFALFFVLYVLIVSLVTLGFIFLMVRLDIDGLEGMRTALYYLKVTYPGFWIAATVALIAGFIVGIYASRKVALPIYKVEQWSRLLKNGDLKAYLGMRESDFWGEMSETCNIFTQELRERVEALRKSYEGDEATLRAEIKKLLDKYST